MHHIASYHSLLLSHYHAPPRRPAATMYLHQYKLELAISLFLTIMFTTWTRAICHIVLLELGGEVMAVRRSTLRLWVR